MNKIGNAIFMVVSIIIALVCFGFFKNAQLFVAETIAQIIMEQVGMLRTMLHMGDYATYIAWGLYTFGLMAILNAIACFKDLFKD